MPSPAGRRDASLVHAPGGPLHARIPRAARTITRCSRSVERPNSPTKVTLQPLRRIEVDAAILFSDLLLPLEPMGIRFDFVKGEGPRSRTRCGREADIERLRRVRAARSARPRPRGHSSGQDRARRPCAAHRVRRCAVHARVVRHRRRPFGQLRANQNADVRPPAGVASPLRAAGGRRQRVSAGADRGRRRCRAGLRLLGGRTERARLPRVHPAAHAPHLRRARRHDVR